MFQQLNELKEKKKQIKKQDSPGANKQIEELNKAIKQLEETHECKFSRSLIGPLALLPIWFSCSIGVRCASMDFPSLAAASFLWVPSLTNPDPEAVIPLINSGLMFAQAQTIKPTNTLFKIVRGVLTVTPFILLPLYSNLPSSVMIFWCTTSLYNIFFVQQLLRNKWFLEKFNFPPLLPNLTHIENVEGFIPSEESKVATQLKPLPFNEVLEKK